MKHILVLTLLLTIGCKVATANVPLYQVELILFSQANKKAFESEHWPDKTSSPIYWKQGRAIELVSSIDAIDQTFTLLPHESWTLTSLVQKLNKFPNYKVISHQAWQQPITHKKQHIRVVGGKQLSSSGSFFGKMKSWFGSDSPKYEQTWQAQGVISLHKRKYFEVSLDIIAKLPTELNGSPSHTFSLNQSRRLRTGELHYFDHPMWGVFVKIVESG